MIVPAMIRQVAYQRLKGKLYSPWRKVKKLLSALIPATCDKCSANTTYYDVEYIHHEDAWVCEECISTGCFECYEPEPAYERADGEYVCGGCYSAGIDWVNGMYSGDR